MTPKTLKALDRRLQRFLEDLLEPMGRSERRHWARVYLEGLLLDGERKSIFGFAKGCITIRGDIVEPIDVEWESAR